MLTVNIGFSVYILSFIIKSFPKVSGPNVYFIGNAREQCILAVLQNQKEILFGLFVVEVNREFVEQFTKALNMHIFNSRVKHESR